MKVSVTLPDYAGCVYPHTLTFAVFFRATALRPTLVCTSVGTSTPARSNRFIMSFRAACSQASRVLYALGMCVPSVRAGGWSSWRGKTMHERFKACQGRKDMGFDLRL